MKAIFGEMNKKQVILLVVLLAFALVAPQIFNSLFVRNLLILIVIWKSGWLDDERVIAALETGVRTALGWLEQGFAFVIEKLKP